MPTSAQTLPTWPLQSRPHRHPPWLEPFSAAVKLRAILAAPRDADAKFFVNSHW